MFVLAVGLTAAVTLTAAALDSATGERNRPIDRWRNPVFEVVVIVDGRPLPARYAKGRRYVEALRGEEYELRIHNSSADRVAVALFVDGLNTIDARHTSAWNASKWVIEPYQTITISGWQMSSERARRFYFTSERDSYGAKLGQTANLGVISAVFFRERRPVIPVTPPPYPITRPDGADLSSAEPSSAKSRTGQAAGENRAVAPMWDKDDAATGIGRSVRHDVRWVDMELDPRAAAEVSIKYEYSRERESSRRFSPEP